MQLPIELFIAYRYTRSRGRSGFVSFISGVSMLGIALGVAALIIVLSVMNGFQKEVRDRMLGVLAHIEVVGPDNRLADWQAVERLARQQPEVRASAPFVVGQALLSHASAVQGAAVRGVLPEAESAVSGIGANMRSGSLQTLSSDGFKVVLGQELARALGVGVGDKVTLIIPQGQVTAAGMIPRLKQFTVSGVFAMGHAEFDTGLALIHLHDAQRLYRLGDQVSGVRLKLDDLHRATEVAQALAARLPPDAYPVDWPSQNRNWFAAVQTEKRMMFIILTLIIAVAAFNLVSSLVMAVNEKRADIAILRTLGATPSSIRTVFLVQGFVTGLIGTLLGVGFGALVAYHIDTILPAIENALGFKFLASGVYYISELPSDPHLDDMLRVGGMSLLLSLLATLYPSSRAAATQPAEALRYE
ncbi:MAG: lipoprotein-releasing ABC transporter permease subunit [Betaproteobacteria bacterium]|nr:lipoprotein-releasing ABC transporter permease subunit [Betaproteobacteria bacterium]